MLDDLSLPNIDAELLDVPEVRAVLAASLREARGE